MPAKNAVERRRGNRLGFWCFRSAARLFGLGGAYGLLHFVCPWYLLTDRPLVGAALAYVRRRFPEHGRLRQLLDVYRLFVSQGRNLIDRHAIAAGYAGIRVEIRGYEALKELLAGREQGFILLTAHVGNWQVAMTALRKFGRDVCLLMRPEDNAAVREALNIDSAGERVEIISTDDGLGGVIAALKALDAGKLISIMGDRPYGFSATAATFLGGAVRFPHGAFTLAAAAQCPVVVLLSARTGPQHYVVDVSHVLPPPVGVRGQKEAAIRRAVADFARILEAYVAANPYQWFVFRDIWTADD
jgi:predicted LPLAT superfamily acyltransferase